MQALCIQRASQPLRFPRDGGHALCPGAGPVPGVVATEGTGLAASMHLRGATTRGCRQHEARQACRESGLKSQPDQPHQVAGGLFNALFRLHWPNFRCKYRHSIASMGRNPVNSTGEYFHVAQENKRSRVAVATTLLLDGNHVCDIF